MKNVQFIPYSYLKIFLQLLQNTHMKESPKTKILVTYKKFESIYSIIINFDNYQFQGLDIQHESKPKPSFNTKSTLSDEVLLDRILGTIYGNCIGDAIGLLTEFMTKKEAMHVSSYSFQGPHTEAIFDHTIEPHKF